MTNKDKFLKDRAGEKEFIEKLVSFALVNGVNIPYRVIRDFFEQPVQPMLTDDERVILRNISNTFNTIRRSDYGFLELYDICLGEWKECQFKDRLFQFIQNGEEYNIEELL